MSSGKWSMLCRDTGLCEGTEGQMGRGSIFFISYLNSNTETLGSVGIPHPCTAFKMNMEQNYGLVVVVIVAH